MVREIFNIEKIYKQLGTPVFRYLYRLTGNRQEAEELTQETFYRLIKSIYRFRRDASLTTWVYKIALNTYREWQRKNGKIAYDYTADIENCSIEEAGDPVYLLENKEKGDLIRCILDSLPENQRIVLILRELEQMSYRQIAAITGRSLAWVKVTLFRARSSFREVYQDGRRDDD